MPGTALSLGRGCRPPPRRAYESMVASPPPILPNPREQDDPIRVDPVGALVVVPIALPVVANFPRPLTGPVATLVAPDTSSLAA